MSRSNTIAVSVLQYHDAGEAPRQGLHLVETPSPEAEAPVIQGVPEDEVQRLVAAARQQAANEAHARFSAQLEAERQESARKLQETLVAFGQQRVAYFAQAEQEIVQLALAIARKILQREAELDPTLLAALVRIALERMQPGSGVRVRLHPTQVATWRGLGASDEATGPKWEVVEDSTIMCEDCFVETEMGTANFGFEAQLADVEKSFSQLLARRPGLA